MFEAPSNFVLKANIIHETVHFCQWKSGFLESCCNDQIEMSGDVHGDDWVVVWNVLLAHLKVDP